MFDPYQSWLGIPPEKQPPTYYQLLAIQPDETDARAIEDAAERQTSRVQRHRVGAHAEECARILNEIAQARAVLLDPAKRKAYDARLAADSITQAEAVEARPATARKSPTKAAITPEQPAAAPNRNAPKRRGPLLVLLGLGTAVVMLGGCLLTAALGAMLWFDFGNLLSGANQDEHAAADRIMDIKLPEAPPDKQPDKNTIKTADPKAENKKETRDPKEKLKDNSNEKPKEQTSPPPSSESSGEFGCKTVLSEPRPERGPVTATACSTDGRLIAWAHGAGVVVYAPATGKSAPKPEPFLRGALALAFSEDGSLFAAASTDRNVYLWKTGIKKPLVMPHGSVARALAFSSDAKFLLTGSQQNESALRLWETATGKLVRTFKGHTNTVSAVAFSADGQSVLSAAQDKVVRWDREAGEPRATYRAQDPFGVSGFLPGARFALGITNHHPLLLWDLDQDREARRFPSRPRTSPYSIACSANGKVAAVGFEKLVQLFDVESGRELATLAGHQDWVWSLALPADGRFVVTGSKDGSVLLWEKDFVPLFNGKDLTGWKTILKEGGEDDGRVFSVRDGLLVISGQPHGYMYTKASYKNYLIRLDWRYDRPNDLVDDRGFQGDSGLLMHITGEPKVWPDSIQVQWYHQEYGLIYLVPHIQNMNYTWNRTAVQKAMRRVGEWNRTEVLSQDGQITCILNGIEVCVGNGKLLEGQIGLQSEGAPLRFKRIDIKRLP